MSAPVRERSGGRLASPDPIASRSQQVLSSNLIRNEFQATERKKILAVLAAKLSFYGHGPEFGGFLYQVKPVRLPSNKNGGAFHTPGRVFMSAPVQVCKWRGTS